DLLGVYRILQGQKALLSERGGHQELRLGDAEERIKRVLAKMTNIEGLERASSQSILGELNQEKGMGRSLRRFINSNFTEFHKQFDDVSSSLSPKVSRANLHGADSDDDGDASASASASGTNQSATPSQSATPFLNMLSSLR
ncbi:unnamed protein product, partial [Polarella glacialis]